MLWTSLEAVWTRPGQHNPATDLKPAGKPKVLWVPRTGQVAWLLEAGRPSLGRSLEPALSLHPPGWPWATGMTVSSG